ncbi:MAG: hypothetical protein Q7R41_05010, partial [Phycisphaerales bacterium]|nr:hypothetical protein [Phycisphaerales bacterium]
AGWLAKKVADHVLDPLYAKAAVFESGGEKVGFASLDTLSVRWTQVSRIRQEVEKRRGIRGDGIMVAATHNHAGPAVVNLGESSRDDAYLAFLVEKVTEAFVEANAGLTPAKVGVGSGFEGRISFNRRYLMRDGRALCHPGVASPEVICPEGVIDAELGVLSVKADDDRMMGLITNFACHPTHLGGEGEISAGYPGAFSRELKAGLGASLVNVFLNGACGDIHHANPIDPSYDDSPERMGAVLAEDVTKVLENMVYSDEVPVGAASATIQLPIRPVGESDLERAANAQRFADDDVYRASIRRLIEKRKVRDFVLAEIQVLRVGDAVFVAIPAEYFVEFGLKIKLNSPAKRTYVVSCANGMVGYVPTPF